MTKIGNRYKEFGLKNKAREKYDAALVVCEEIMIDAKRLAAACWKKPTFSSGTSILKWIV